MLSDGKKGEEGSYERRNGGISAQNNFAIIKKCFVEVLLILLIWIGAGVGGKQT